VDRLIPEKRSSLTSCHLINNKESLKEEIVVRKKRLTNEYVKDEIEKVGYKLLSEYSGCHEKIKIECDKGHVYNIAWKYFKRGQRCATCSGFHISIGYIREYMLNLGYRCLSKNYKNNRSLLLILCPNNHMYETSWSVFLNKKGCQICRKYHQNKEITKSGKLINRIYRNKEWMYNQYINKKMSSKEIGNFCGVNHRMILNWLKRHNIQIRSISEGTSIGQINDKKLLDIKVPRNRKLCFKCGDILKFDEFRKHKGTKDGLQIYCKLCMSEYDIKYANSKFVKYRNVVDFISNKNYRKYFKYINPLKLKRSFEGYNLDHIVSVKDGFDNNISPDILSSPVNLRMLSFSENQVKKTKSDMSISDLYFLHNKFINEFRNLNYGTVLYR